jgi:hypothetical protein
MSKNRKFSFYSLIVFLLLIFAIVLGCNEETVSPNNIDEKETNNYENLVFSDKIELFNYPSFGSNNTSFKFDIIVKDPSLKISKIKYDFTHDMEYDTTLTALNTVKTKFNLFGYNTIIATVEFEDKSVLSCSTVVWLTQPRVISSGDNVYYEPNIYNGNIISVTHGVGHKAQLINMTTYQMNCYFCEFNSDSFNEMHCTIPSFDGNKMLFDNGINYNFCYYDFAKNDGKIIDIPIALPIYPIGQITWSLDNESIYYISVDNDYHENGVKSYNLLSNDIKDVYSNGSHICIVPDQEDKLAILEKVNESSSKLLIYNTATNSIEKEYSNIPFNGPFRMIKDTDRIYLDGKLAFYSLSKEILYYMEFEELDLQHHMYGEADINMDGNQFIIGTYNTTRALYSIPLPNYF